MSSDNTNTESCQVDFYLLGPASPGAGNHACRLALMAWERKQTVFIVTATQTASEQLDELMWQYPEGRFLPHARAEGPDSGKAGVNIGVLSSLKPADVVINLGPEAIPEPVRFNRILEIVPTADDERQASRVKYKTYRNLGITPRMQDINT